jgi:hypothetical protein
MAISVKQFLLLILFVCFALAALMNSERALMLEIVKLVTFGTLVVMGYGIWANNGASRAYCIGFVVWGGLYYIQFVVLQSEVVDLGTDNLLRWLGQYLEQGRVIWAVYEKTGHLLLSLFFGIIGGLITVYFYYKRQRMLVREHGTSSE